MCASTKHLGVFIRMALLLSLAACTSSITPDDSAAGTCVGTITTEGQLSSVVNEAGSVWGGTAGLAEELSIGVAAGEPVYMLGPVRSVWDSGDRIFLIDASVPAVRAYDSDGGYLGDVGRDGLGPPVWLPELEVEELRNCVRPDCLEYLVIPFQPLAPTVFAPNGAIIGGAADSYSFEIRGQDGDVTQVRRVVDPVVLAAEEWAYWIQAQRTEGLARNAAWQRSWSDEVRRQKPAYRRLFANRDGNILVVREGPSRRLSDCSEDPQPDAPDFVRCWEGTQLWDYFARDGRYLGAIEPPGERLRSVPFLRDATVTIAVENDLGTIMVKRYRLVLPGEQGR